MSRMIGMSEDTRMFLQQRRDERAPSTMTTTVLDTYEDQVQDGVMELPGFRISDRITEGKHKGKMTFGEIYCQDKPYTRWVRGHIGSHSSSQMRLLKAYIEVRDMRKRERLGGAVTEMPVTAAPKAPTRRSTAMGPRTEGYMTPWEVVAMPREAVHSRRRRNRDDDMEVQEYSDQVLVSWSVLTMGASERQDQRRVGMEMTMVEQQQRAAGDPERARLMNQLLARAMFPVPMGESPP